MGFDDEIEFNDDFGSDLPSAADSGEKGKKSNHKDFRRTKKKGADKGGDSSPLKKGFFNRRNTKSDEDEASDDMFHSLSGGNTGSIGSGNTGKSGQSEFSYLFAPPREGETEDDVYPDSSIYSDNNAAKNMLGGLAYDGSDGGEANGFNQYFDNPSQTRPASQFGFQQKHDDDFSLPSVLNTPIGSAKASAGDSPASTFSPTPPPIASPTPTDKPDSYLPDLRSDSVFLSSDRREPTPTPITTPAPITTDPPAAEPPHIAETADSAPKPDEITPTENVTQEFLPYGGMYPSYPMNAMAPMMMNYPLVIPNGTQGQGTAPYQTIPIPYPMPMPMPMYNQYPQYMPPQPQYVVVPQVQPQPVYTPPPRYDDRYYYDDEYEDRRDRRRRRDDRYYDERDRREREYDDRYGDRAAARYYDERRGRYERRSDRYYDRIDGRSYGDDQRADRKTYPKPPYEPPYDRHEPETAAPAPAPAPITAESFATPANPAPLIENKPMNTTPPVPPKKPASNDNLLSGFDAAFDSPAPSDSFGFDMNSFGMNSFDSDVFDPNGSFSPDNGGFDEFSAGTPFDRR